jgi:threonine/homoserine/homoserine lactone efflux protein
MLSAPRAVSPWARAVATLLATVAGVSLPVELTIRLVEHPVVAPPPAATVLMIGSCLLLVWSGLGLRRLEAARALARRPTPGP